MKPSVLKLTRTTAIALGLMATYSAWAQPYDSLSGVVIPPCGAKAQATDAGTLTAEAFGKKGAITAEMVLSAASRDEICINGKGKLKLRGESAALMGNSDSESAVTPPVEPTVEGLANALAAGTADANSGRDDDAAATILEPIAPDILADGNSQNAPAEGNFQAAMPEATATEPAVLPQADVALAPPSKKRPKPAPEMQAADAEPPAALATEADANGRATEPAQVSETTVTEENSRSSSEEFAKPDSAATASNNSSDKGLSNLEKFAIGAAGVAALGLIIGNNREVVSNSGDRVILRDQNGDLEVLRDDDTLLRRPGSDVKTETFSDGSTRTTVTRRDGSKIVTIADASGRVIKRTRVTAAGREVLLIDDTEETRPVDVTRLPSPPPQRETFDTRDRESLEAALRAESRTRIDRSFTLRQVREYREVRELMPEITIDAINFETGSAAIQPQEAEELLDLGEALSAYLRDNPDELFLVEGHTDAVGDAAYNLALSDRRAESVALALTEYFDVPPENLIIQGYGESELLVPTSEAERANRRATVRRITPLLR